MFRNILTYFKESCSSFSIFLARTQDGSQKKIYCSSHSAKKLFIIALQVFRNCVAANFVPQEEHFKSYNNRAMLYNFTLL
jgi:hypothetical protein